MIVWRSKASYNVKTFVVVCFHYHYCFVILILGANSCFHTSYATNSWFFFKALFHRTYCVASSA